MLKWMLFCFCQALFVSWGFISSALAVEMSQSEFEQTKTDFVSLLSDRDTELKWLQRTSQSSKEDVFLKTSNDRQGGLVLRHPLPEDSLLVLQIPHGFFDLHTREIADMWWHQGIGDVLMFNTEQRYKTDHSDLSRLKQTLFTAFTEVLLDEQLSARWSKIHIVQLHGFNAIKRKSLAGNHTDFILSNGTLMPDTYLQKMQSCLRDNGNLLSRVYGRDVFELGATVNPIGRLINAEYQKRVSFLHIEMPLSIRNGLVQERLSQATIKCLVEF